MRYDDASGSFSAVTGNPDARDDADVLPAGSHGPATGNTITGAGTITGQAGADLVPDGAGKIVALEGAGGSDTSDGGSLHVGGRFGDLTMDANGNYRYQPTVETPNGARDVFRYTLADNAGARDAATLTIEIGREPQKIDANAQQIIPGPDGVVTLPPGVELSDIHVVGRNLVIDMPDGTQMVIIDGAVFVPQLVLNGVEVPATNLAALLIDTEPQPAAGIPQSSGGNFDVPVPPLDPGVPLGDLIPPTELVFTPPEFHDIGQFIDREPEAGTVNVQLDDDAKAGGNPGTPAVGDDPDSVNATGFLPGSGGDGALTWDLSNSGAPAGFTYVDGPNGSILVQQVQNAITVTVLTITVNPATGAYTVVQNAAILHPSLDGQAGDNTENNVNFTIGYTVTDSDGDSAPGTMTIDVDDDTPTVTVTAGSDADVILTTHDAATIGAASEAVSTSVNFGGVFTGTTVSPGADGAGSGTTSGYALSTTGGASGLTQGGVAINLYNVGGVIVGSTAATAGAIDASNTVFTVSTTNTGVVTLTQFSQIDHTNTDPSPTGAPFTDHIISLTDGSITLTRSETVVDRDGDSVTGSASVGIGANLRFVDDGPTISLADRGEDQLVVDETDLTTNATGNFAANFSASFGADGPAVGGGISYTLGINAGVTGLVDTLTGQAVVLSVVGGQVVGTAGAGGPVVFTVSVSSSGVVTLDQQRAVVHDDPTDPDEPGVSAATLNADNLITLTATATDRDGDTASQLINIGQNLHFEDDGPNVSNLQPGPGVTLDETTGAIAGTAGGMTTISATSASAVISATSAFGNDGPAAVGATVYGLSLSGGGATIASGLQTAVGDFAITLNLVDSTHITGTYNGANIAFTITMNANGTITVQQNVPLEHLIDGSSAAAHDDALDLVLDGEAATNLVNATITIKDGDGDTATGSVGIGNLIVFEDDGPSINVTAGSDAAVVLQTQDADTIGGLTDTNATSAAFGGVFGATSSGGADGSASVNGIYTLGVPGAGANGVDSGLDQTGANIYLHLIGGKVVGSTSQTLAGVNAGNTVFDVGVSGTGVVTLTQYSQIDHPIAGDPTATAAPFVDHILGMADGLVTLTFSSTVTDNDGDTATDSETVNIGANLTFADDGPDISAVLTGTQIRIDETDNVVAAGGETDGPGGNLGTVTMSAVSLFTVSNVHVSADAPTTNSYALTLSSQGVASGLLLSTTNDPIFLYNIGGVISGSTSVNLAGVNAGNTVFTASINTGTGAITLTQFFAVEHGTPGASYDEDSSALNAGVLNVTITATDFDGDTDTASVDLGSVIRFEDDGPTIDVTKGSDSTVLIQTQDHDTIGVATDTASSSANFGGVFGLTSAGGSDGAATTPSLSYVLGVPGAGASGVDSGLDQTGANIYLYVIGGKVVGSTSATLAGVTAGNTVFDVAVSGTGVVTLTQYSQIDHPIAGDPTPTITPFADHIISMTDSLVTLTANASITDNDGDIATDSETVNIGANLQFADDGPIATNDTDTIVGGNGPATGNVITGVDIVGGDANSTDGNADTVNADIPGTITRIQSVNVPANVDTTYDGSGNLVVLGQYGTLTINADGSYSYLRTSAAGGVTDTFTYTLTDRDGDTATATLAIGIQDNFPAAGTINVLLDDDALAGGNPGTLAVGDDTPDTQNTSGSLIGTGGDAPLTFSFSGAGAPAGFTYDVSTPGVLLIKQGSVTVITVTITNTTTGTYTVVQNAPILHDTQNGVPGLDNTENNQTFAITYNVTDFDGDVATPAGTININVDDDTPTINVTKGADSGVILGTEDAATIGGLSDTAVTTANFSGVFGLTQSVGADGGAAATLSYALDVTGYTGGPAGIDSGLDQGGNSIFLYEIAGKVVGSTSTTLAGVLPGNTVFDVGVASNGVVTLTQYSQIDHPIAGDPTPTITPFVDHIISMADALITLTASSTITDNDGDTMTDSEVVNIGANIQFTDDGPDIAAVLTGTQIRIDETDGVTAAGGEVDPVGGDLGTVTMTLASLVTLTSPHVSADSPTTNVYSLVLSAEGVNSGLTESTGNLPIFLYESGGVITGSTAVTEGGINAGNTAFTVSINAGTGAVTLTQFQGIEHPTAPSSYDEDSSGLTAGVLNLVATATDFDGDTDSAQVDLGSVIRFEDDGPALSFGATVPNPPTSKTATGTMNLNIGSDDWTPATLVDTFINVTANGGTVGTVPVALTTFTMGAVTANTSSLVTYAFSFSYDTDPGAAVAMANGTGSITINKGTNQYSVTIDQSIGYSSTVQTNQALSRTGYNAEEPANDVSSGDEITVSQLTPTFFVQFSGDHNSFAYSGGPNGTFSGDPSYVSISGDSNGVASDTIAQDDVLNMNFYTADPGGDATPEQTRAAADATFIQIDHFGSDEDLVVVLTLADPNNLNSTITRTFIADHNDFFFIGSPLGTTPAGYTFTFDQDDAVLIIEANDYRFAGDPVQYVIVGMQIVTSTQATSGSGYNLDGSVGAGGGIDSLVPVAFSSDTSDNDVTKIVNIGFKLTTASPQPITLNFNVTAQDSDGDVTANVPLGVTFPASVMPVVLDLNGDGVQFLDHSAGVAYDYDGDGIAEATAWAAPDDGILVRDANGNGTVDNASEFVFGGNGLTDLQALAVQYGSVLDANDADFASFAVWQDANSNGVSEAGELISLTAASIASISLVSDGISYEAANGDVTVAGTGSYTKADGSTGALADASFRAGWAAVDDQRTMAAANNNSVLLGAIAAAGLGASSAVAASDDAPAEPGAVQSVAAGSGAAQDSDVGGDDASRSALSGETREAVDVQPQGGSSASYAEESAAQDTLTDSDNHVSDAPAPLLGGTDTNDQPALSQSSFTSEGVGMPSAEMLAAANANDNALEGQAQSDGEVGRVLFDALAGGGHGPNLDAVIDAVANQAQGGAQTVIDALASHGPAAVSGWDMASIADFTGVHAAFTMEHMTFHIDAAPAAA